jgi:spermidine/putrescine transport system ATP-binding protein
MSQEVQTGADSPSVRLEHVTKRFGDFTAVREMELDIPRGQFFTMLGPSGCGKTTTLRMVAGFEEPTEGRVLLDGDDVTGMPAFRRPTNTVFQSYALFPHRTVEQNVAFGLQRQKVEKAEVKRRVGEELERVGLSPEAKRRPAQLSGGQQQRVALARALVNRPAVLLLDEPLGALDLKLRKQLQVELKRIQRDVGITFIYVTHDQEEALTMSDRIAVMSRGRVEQVGGPQEIYEEPSTAYVADFLGVSNLMDARAKGTTQGGCQVQIGDFPLVAGQGESDAQGDVKIVIRPERVVLEPQGTNGQNRVPAMVERVVYVGSTMQVIVHLASGQTIQAWVPNRGEGLGYSGGAAVSAHLPPEALRVLIESASVEDIAAMEEQTA